MTALLVILAISLGTYVMRVSMFVLVASRPIPDVVDRALGLVGPAAVAALVATMAFTRSGSVHLLPGAELMAVVAGFAVVRHTGKVVHAFAVGMPIVWLGGFVGI